MNDSSPNDFNPAPEAKLNGGAVDNNASYGKRFAAFIVDSLLIGIAVAMMFEYLGLGPDQSQAVDMQTLIKNMAEKVNALSKEQRFFVLIFPYIMFFVFHGYSLFHSGQTIGKRLLGIAIVTMDNQKPPFGPLILHRYFSQWIVGMLPGLGFLLRVADILLIFRSDRRCVHDLLAKTKVIDLSIKVETTATTAASNTMIA